MWEFSWVEPATKIFQQQKFPELRYVHAHYYHLHAQTCPNDVMLSACLGLHDQVCYFMGIPVGRCIPGEAPLLILECMVKEQWGRPLSVCGHVVWHSTTNAPRTNCCGWFMIAIEIHVCPALPYNICISVCTVSFDINYHNTTQCT